MQRDSEAIAVAMATLTETVVRLCGSRSAAAGGNALAKRALTEIGDLRALIEGMRLEPETRARAGVH